MEKPCAPGIIESWIARCVTRLIPMKRELKGTEMNIDPKILQSFRDYISK
jgi:hypothetical protein